MITVINVIKHPKGSIQKRSTTKHINKSNLGQSLEDDLNITNQHYRNQKLALVYKKPTPVQVVQVDFPKRSAAKIIEAYYKLPSTTDYNGLCQGVPIDFEAKQTTNLTRFPLAMIYQHQIDHLRAVNQHGGISFLIIRFSAKDETYFIDFKDFDEFLKTSTRQSIPYRWFEKNATLLETTYHAPCHYYPEMIKLINKRKETSQ